MITLIDNFLNKITMYRLVLYYLIFLVLAAIGLSFFGVLAYSPLSLLSSAIIITAICWVMNSIFAWAFEAPTNIESFYITAFILVLIITPAKSLRDFQYLSLACWAAVWAIASKFIFAIRKKHLFNPAAFAVALTAFVLGQSASWWVGTAWMVPFVLVGGLLIVRKLRRFDLVWSFFLVSMATILLFNIAQGFDVVVALRKIILDTPLLFFAFVMLTEPLTTPPRKNLQIWYGAFVGFLFAPQIHIGPIYSTPELALLVGNIFSYIVSPKEKLMLILKEKRQIAPSMYDFVFAADSHHGAQGAMTFPPGQYLEWTLAHKRPDSRGNRRYFTIASSPTEKELRMGVKFYSDSSSFKKKLVDLKPGDMMVASQRAGDFTMPEDKDKKLVFIAGGIGVTPFRSMIKYLLDHHEKRDIVFLFSNRAAADIVYKDIFDEAAEKLGITTIYTVTDDDPSWNGRKGMITEGVIVEEIPDYKERIFYLSGPRSMVVAFEKTLKKLGVPHAHIKTDFFPGFV